jgi:hypothetical protein
MIMTLSINLQKLGSFHDITSYFMYSGQSETQDRLVCGLLTKILMQQGSRNSNLVTTTSCSSHQEIPPLLWNVNINCHVHKSLEMDSILNQMNVCSRFTLILSSHESLVNPSALVLSDCLNQILYAFFCYTMYAICSAHHILLMWLY